MKALIFYDSVYGNTKKIAEAVADGFRELKAECRLIHATEVTAAAVAAADLVVIGSPTRAFRAVDSVVKALKDPGIPYDGKKFAAFDTRIDPADIKSGFFRRIVTSFGYATDQIVKLAVKRGAVPVADPVGFCVTGKEGTILRKGEAERAFGWAKALFETHAKK